MRIRKAVIHDLPGINALMNVYGKMSIDRDYINSRDVGLCASDDDGKLVGFIWGGMLCKNKLVYIDKFVVDAVHSKRGVGQALQRALFQECVKRGARKGFGIIRHDEFHERAGFNALKMACMADPAPYTFVTIDAMNTKKELGV